MVLSITDVMKTAWDKSNGAKGTIWACIGITFLAQILSQLLMSAAAAIGGTFLMVAVAIACMVIVFLLTAGLIYVCIRRVKGESIDYTMIKYPFSWRCFLNLLIFHILINVVLTWGLFFIVTLILGAHGIVLIVLFFLLLFIMVRIALGIGLILDKNMDAITAIKHSFTITTGNTLRLVLLWILVLLLMAISAIPFGIGLIWTLPWVQLCYAETYKRLALDATGAV